MDINKIIKENIIHDFVKPLIDNNQVKDFINNKGEPEIKEWLYFLYILEYEFEYKPKKENMEEFKDELYTIFKYFLTNAPTETI